MDNKVDATSLVSQITATMHGLLSSLASPPSSLVVGFSGGVDSSFLLHALSFVSSEPSLSFPQLHAVYVNHGLSKQADYWQQHCQNFCHQRSIRFSAVSVDVPDLPRTSLEATARDARYDALLTICKNENGALVLGQHQDDQAETLLLALKRGSGPAGLAGMPASTVKEGVALLRPMLSIPRTEIESAARNSQLDWIEDESNDDSRFDRNFLRNEVVPALVHRWPEFGDAVSKSAELLQEQNALLAEVTAARYHQVLQTDGTLSVTSLTSFAESWQRAIVRYWLQQHGKPMPSRRQLGEILSMLEAREDASPFVSIASWRVRRYNHKLYLCDESLAEATPETIQTGDAVQLAWWPAGFRVSGNGSWQAMPAVNMEKLTLADNPLGKTPGKWFKEWKVPPWLRQQVPLLVRDAIPVALVLTDRVVMLDGSGGAEIFIELLSE